MPTNDNRHAYSGATRGVADRFNRTKMGKAARRSGYVTPETVTMWAAYVVTVLCNLLFEATRLGGTTSGEVANLMYVWFMPAGYVFSIWGLIYVALIVWLVQYTRDAPNRVRRFGFVALLFVVSCALNVAWLALFHFLQVYVGLFVDRCALGRDGGTVRDRSPHHEDRGRARAHLHLCRLGDGGRGGQPHDGHHVGVRRRHPRC